MKRIEFLSALLNALMLSTTYQFYHLEVISLKAKDLLVAQS